MLSRHALTTNDDSPDCVCPPMMLSFLWLFLKVRWKIRIRFFFHRWYSALLVTESRNQTYFCRLFSFCCSRKIKGVILVHCSYLKTCFLCIFCTWLLRHCYFPVVNIEIWSHSGGKWVSPVFLPVHEGNSGLNRKNCSLGLESHCDIWVLKAKI